MHRLGRYLYREAILAELARHGVVPRPTTSPETSRWAVNGLYRYELRRLRDRLARCEFPKKEYIERVVEIRERYTVMSIPVRLWTQETTTE